MRIREKNEILKNTISLIMLYCLLLFSSGFYFQAFNGTFSISVMLICVIILSITNQRVYDKNCNNILFLVTGLTVFMGIAGLINQEGIKQSLIAQSGIIIAFGIVFSLNFEKFKFLYTNLLLIIATGSLFFWGISYISPAFIKLFPTLTNSAGSTNYFCVVATINFRNMRNYGIFWEPGAFQVFLSIAMIFEIFSEQKTRLGAMIIFSLAMLSTFSSIALLSLLLIFSLWILRLKINPLLKIGVFLSIAVVSIGSIILLTKISPDFKYAFIDKIKDFFNPNSVNPSVIVRRNSIIEPFRLFLSSPLFGVGYKNIVARNNTLGYDIAATTILYWFARYGFFIGNILLIGLYQFTNLITKNVLRKIILFITIVVFTLTENFAFNPCFLILPLYGLKLIIEKRKRGDLL